MTHNHRGWLLRAGAEFFVIVLGVLLALGVDQWVSDRADRVLEREYLSALATDLRTDSTAYAEILLPSLTRAQAALEDVSRALRGPAPLTADPLAFLQSVLWSSSYVSQFETRRATYEELVATGRLQLVESADIRSQIVAYYDQIRLSANLSEARASGYARLVAGYLPFEQDVTLDRRADAVDPRTASALAAAPDFLPALNRHSRLVRYQLGQVRELTERIDVLLGRLQQEIRR